MNKLYKWLGVMSLGISASASLIPFVNKNESVNQIQDLNNKSFSKNSNEVNDVDLNLLEKFVNGEGIYGYINNAIVKGGLTIDPKDNKSQTKVVEATKVYIIEILKQVKFWLHYDINVDELMNIISFNFYSDQEGYVEQVDGVSEIKSFKISIVNGKEDNISGFYMHGSSKFKVINKTNLQLAITNRDFQQNLNSSEKLKKYIVESNDLISESAIEITNFTHTGWINGSANVVISQGINNLYYLDDNNSIKVTFIFI
ncbi:hypothetical protein SHELI_v1c09920 [Spiroplasma helicoides]|uniref:Uncharacterized protein n=1 Tax=Spiroplasma helicoides TaxID=216938 RepID=A0A1B3SLX5_9MOLU|nr:hypothetical protein [Spiroplasma helicoides]AOG60939.1 hypothetical protein SHELI_v1c09920 [Spiroplasma helicoides]